MTFVGLGWFGALQHNEEQAMRRLQTKRFGAYVASFDFWRSVFQCWEVKAFALTALIVLSVFLRPEGSPESKPVDAPVSSTGETDA